MYTPFANQHQATGKHVATMQLAVMSSTKDIEYFVRMHPDSTETNIGGCTGERLLCKQQGDIALINEETGEIEEISHVMYLPEGKDNIISEGAMTKSHEGCWFLTINEERWFGKPGRGPMSLTKTGNHGIIKIRPVTSEDVTKDSAPTRKILAMNENIRKKRTILSKTLVHNRTHVGSTLIDQSKNNFENVTITGTVEMCDAGLHFGQNEKAVLGPKSKTRTPTHASQCNGSIKQAG